MNLVVIVLLIPIVLSSGVIPRPNDTSTIVASKNQTIPMTPSSITINVQESKPEAITGDWIALIGGLAATGGLVFTGFTYLKNSKNTQTRILREIQDEITKIELLKERVSDYPIFAVQYLNALDRVAYLVSKRLLPNHVAYYYKERFAAALAILEKEEFIQYKQVHTHLIYWCKLNCVKPSQAP